MPEPQDWTEADLLTLIGDGEQESLTLEYKACDSLQKTEGKKNEISKDISAFANSAGGTIVYGMLEDGHKPMALDEGFDPNEIAKEWLEQVINSRIYERIDGVIINPVDLEILHPGRVAYVVCPPQSDRRPHQASDNKYYKRFNFQSVPMEHYEVKDMMFRQRVPEVEFVGAIATAAGNGATGEKFWANFRIGISVRNTGNVVAELFGVEVRIPKVISRAHSGGHLDWRPWDPNIRSRLDGEEEVFLLNGPTPLFPGQVQTLGTASITITHENIEQTKPLVVPVTIYAGNMPPVLAEFRPFELV